MVATRRLVLFHVEDEAFEVLAFGVVDVYGVILGLMQLVEDAHGASHLRCRREDGETESLFVHSLGAGEGKEDAAGSDHLNRLGIDLMLCGHEHRCEFEAPSGRISFPVLTNGNETAVVATYDGQALEAQVVDTKGSVVERKRFAGK